MPDLSAILADPTNPPGQRLGTVVLLSAEPWDEVWRRNQHLSTSMIRLGLAERLIFVSPGAKLEHRRSFEPEPRIRVVTPHLLLPRHCGGVELLAREIRVRVLSRAHVLWVNDAVLGARCLRGNLPAVYDVTDDWRSAAVTAEDRTKLVKAEDVLARSAETIVCSEVLRDRWLERYGVVARVVHNGVDASAHVDATPVELAGPAPHVMYVGTLHRERLDVELLIQIARSGAIGTVHLVGPDIFDDASRRRLTGVNNIELHGQVPYVDVPRWMASADVLLCPHVVNHFTLSLDAIKSFEYVASGRPVLATPTSGFQKLGDYDGVHVVVRERYVKALAELARNQAPTVRGRGGEHDWSNRARDFALLLSSATVRFA